MRAKGIEPFMAAIILLAISISMAILLSTWITSITTDSTKSVGKRLSTSVECNAASITIEKVYAINKTKGVVIVRNDGFANLSIMGAQIINTSGNNFSSLQRLPLFLSRGSLVSLDFDINLSSCPGSFSQAIVSSDCTADAVFNGMPECIS